MMMYPHGVAYKRNLPSQSLAPLQFSADTPRIEHPACKLLGRNSGNASVAAIITRLPPRVLGFLIGNRGDEKKGTLFLSCAKGFDEPDYRLVSMKHFRRWSLELRTRRKMRY